MAAIVPMVSQFFNLAHFTEIILLLLLLLRGSNLLLKNLSRPLEALYIVGFKARHAQSHKKETRPTESLCRYGCLSLVFLIVYPIYVALVKIFEPTLGIERFK